jgi:hypothetical protein
LMTEFHGETEVYRKCSGITKDRECCKGVTDTAAWWWEIREVRPEDCSKMGAK